MWAALAPIASSIFGGLFGGGNRQQQQQQDQYAQQLEQTQDKILNAMFNRAQNTYWPVENQALAGVSSRAQNLPAWAPGAMQESATLAKPMDLTY